MLDFQAARWLTDGRGAEAGRQQPSDRDPDRRIQDRRTATSTSPSTGQKIWERFCNAHRRARSSIDASGLRDRRAALEEPRRAQRRDRQARPCTRPAPSGSRCLQQGRRAVRADLRDRPDVRRLRRSSISASRSRSTRPDGSEQRVCRPAGDAVAHAEQDRGAAARRSASIPTRCSRNSASARMRSPSCARRRRDLTARAGVGHEGDAHDPDRQDAVAARKAASAI